MTRFMVLVCLLMGLLMGVVSPADSVEGGDSEVPYIYYYSDFLNAFVIERADGTDSRLFAADLMPENTDMVTGAGWSPSGKYLAWSAEGRHAFVVSTDGEQHLSLLADFFQVEMVWSPIEDVLMVIGLRDIRNIDDEAGQATTTLQFLLIDVETEEIISSYEQEQAIYYDEFENAQVYWVNLARPDAYWKTDGQHVIVRYHVRESYDDSPNIVGFQVFDLEGNIREHIYNETLITTKYAYLADNDVTTISYYPHDDPTTIVIDDLISGEEVGRFSLDATMYEVHWRPRGDAALFMGDSEIWLWQYNFETMQPILMNARSFTVGMPVWSPDGAYAVVLREDNTPQLFSYETQSIDALPINGWPNVWQWTDNRRLLFSTRHEENTIYDIDLTTGTVFQTFPRDNPYSFYDIGQWSPDETQFAYVNDGLEILNLDDHSTTTFRPDGRGWYSNLGGDAYWNPDGEWLIISEDALVADGGGAPHWIGITKSDGSGRRDLASCWDSACYGWLPDNVNLNQFPHGQPQSVLPSPSSVIHANQWSFYLSWSPDGSQILRGKSNEGGGGESTIIDVESGQVISQFDALDFEGAVEWMLTDEGQYIPQIVEVEFEAIQPEDAIITQSPDGELFVVNDGHQVHVYYYDIGEILPFSEIDVNTLSLADFSPDGTFLVVSRPQSRTKLYDATTLELITTLNTNGTAVAFSPDGQTLAVASSWDIQLWDVGTLLENAEDMSEG